MHIQELFLAGFRNDFNNNTFIYTRNCLHGMSQVLLFIYDTSTNLIGGEHNVADNFSMIMHQPLGLPSFQK